MLVFFVYANAYMFVYESILCVFIDDDHNNNNYNDYLFNCSHRLKMYRENIYNITLRLGKNGEG